MSKLAVAKVILPIALDREFDYSIPENYTVHKGNRVLVDFNRKKRVGIVVGKREGSKIVKLKPLLDILDTSTVLSQEHIKFGQSLCEKYPYTLGEFLFMMLPSYFKKPRKFTSLTKEDSSMAKEKKHKPKVEGMPIFVKGDAFADRYQVWKEYIQKALRGGSVLICFPQISYLKAAKSYIEKDFEEKVCVIHSTMGEKTVFDSWKRSRQSSIILGTRVAAFYYPQDLNLIIVDEESSPYYLQEEKPFHHLRDVAFMLSKLKGSDFILSGDFPSLEAYKLIKDKRVSLIEVNKKQANIKVINESTHRKGQALSPLLAELLRKSVEDKKRAVVIYNRKGFGAIIACNVCGYIYKCQHCSTFLKLSADGKAGICPYCNHQSNLPPLCTKCKNGYIVSRGLGIERIGLFIKRIFPEVKISNWNKKDQDSAIVLATSGILSVLYGGEVFDRGFVLGIDSALSRLDYEATFNAFTYISRLSLLFKESLFVFTHNIDHYLFRAIKQSWQEFYEEELALRKELNLPPYGTLAKITMREKNENRLLKHANQLYNKLSKQGFDVYGPLKEKPFKLRDKYRYTVIAKSKKDTALREAINQDIKGLRSSYLKVAALIR